MPRMAWIFLLMELDEINVMAYFTNNYKGLSRITPNLLCNK
ncbi:hypothetical protein CRYPA_1932 [uncultured Candidatus Thioglobus sp.]|nr:hypothetical protein CRYPA_1932 [uncultured Candidatus Thioglobus sp.]